MRKKYQSKGRKANHKFEMVRGQELLVQVPLPMAEVWAEMQAQPGRTSASAESRPGCVRSGEQPGYVVFGGAESALTLSGSYPGPFQVRRERRAST